MIRQRLPPLLVLLVHASLHTACKDNEANVGASGQGGSGGSGGGGAEGETATSGGAASTMSASTTSGLWQEGDCVHPRVVEACSKGWCEIPAGCFIMGSPEDEWERALNSETPTPVTLTRPFEIGQHEVTQAEWEAAGFTNPSAPGENTSSCLESDCPVGNVNFFEAAMYANHLSEQHDPPLTPCYRLSDCAGEVGSELECQLVEVVNSNLYACDGYRLPTEPEWEYAARAGARTAFYAGDITPQDVPPGSLDCYSDPALVPLAWYCFDSNDSTHPVEQKQPNGWGLFDVLGNALELTSTLAVGSDGYGGKPLTDPKPTVERTDEGYLFNARGGFPNSTAQGCRLAARRWISGAAIAPGMGFRLVRSLRP